MYLYSVIFRAWLYNIKYAYLIQIILFIDETLTGNATPDQRGPGSNGNNGIPHTAEISRTRASSLDAF